MKKNVLLFALPVLLLALLVFVWRSVLAPRGTAPADEAAPVAEPSETEAPVDAVPPAVDTERPLPRGDRSVASEDPGAARPTETFPLGGATWIDGRVILPADGPPEPDLEVVVLSVAERELDDLEIRARDGWLALLEPTPAGNLLDPDEWTPKERTWSRRPVEADGAFRAPCSAEAHAALVFLKGDYLHMEAPARVALAAGERACTLEPEIGGRLVLTFVPPATAPADAVAALPGTVVSYSAFDGSSAKERRRRVGDDLVCICPQLPAGTSIYWAALTTTFVPPFQFGGDAIEAGRDLARDVELELGARISGSVTDPDGTPLVGAWVRARQQSSGPFGFGPDDSRVQETESDGRFELRALRAADAELHVTQTDFRPEVVRIEGLVEGEERRDVTIVLTAGERVAGIASLPGGEPAAGAEVRLVDTGRSNAERTAVHDSRKVAADADGRFSIGGLGTGPFALRAVHRAAGEEGEVLHKVYVEDVRPTDELALALAPTLALACDVRDDVGRPVPSFRLRARQQDVAIPHAVQAPYEDAGTSVRLAGLVPGRWQVSASAPGRTPSDDLAVVLPHGGAPIAITLTRAGAVAGRVLDPDGRPVAGGEVAVEGSSWRTTATEDDGSFRIEDLPAGPLTVVADSDDWAPSEELDVELAPGGTVDGLVLELRLGGSLTGEVYAPDGSPAIGAMIMVQAARGNDDAQLISDAEGRFAAEHLEPGSYNVIAMPDLNALGDPTESPEAMGSLLSKMETASAAIVEGQTTHVVLGAPPADPVRLVGLVSAGGVPLAHALLAIVGEDRAMLDALDFHQTDADGRYSVVLDAPGNYVVFVSRGMGSDESTEFNVAVPAVEVHEVDLAVPLGAIRGRVVDPTGRGLEGQRVDWTRAGALTSLQSTFGDRSVSTAEDGAFELTWLAPGTYTLRAGPRRGDDEPSWSTVTLGGVAVAADEVVEGLEIVLGEPGRLVGRVVDAAGAPVAGAAVWVRDASGRIVHPDAGARSDATGGFTYDGLPAGPLTVVASAGESGLASDEVGPVTILPGGETSVELALSPGGWLDVAVEDEDGGLIPHRLDVFDSEGRLVSGLSAGSLENPDRTLSSTTRTIGPLASARYRVVATAPDGRTADRPVTVRAGQTKSVRLRFRE